MKKTLTVLSILALAGIGFAGCGSGGDGDACETNADCDALSGYVCNTTTKVCQSVGGSGVVLTPVDNKEYCKGKCNENDFGRAENCFIDKGEDEGFCSSCKVNCAGKYPLFPVCDEGTGYCVAKENPCTADQVIKANDDGETAICIVNEVKTCQDESGCEQGYTCNLDTHKCEVSTNVDPQFKFVRVDDLSDPCEKDSDGLCHLDDPGADIDAIALVKTGKATTYAKTVKGYVRSDGATETVALVVDGKKPAVDPTKAIGEPDSFLSYATSGTSDGKCVYYSDTEKTIHPYVSLGGKGGYIIVEMSEKIEAGDKIDVLEVGKCTLQNTSQDKVQTAQSEKIQVQVSVNDKDGWKVIGEGEATSDNKGVVTFEVTADKLQ
jgi:hypothetical protein